MNSSALVSVITACLIYQVVGVSVDVNKQACIRDSSVNPSLVEKAYNGDISDARSLKCYFKCYYENAGYINAKGEIQADKLKANTPAGVSKTNSDTAVDLCVKKGKDACETAYLTQTCLLTNGLAY